MSTARQPCQPCQPNFWNAPASETEGCELPAVALEARGTRETKKGPAEAAHSVRAVATAIADLWRAPWHGLLVTRSERSQTPNKQRPPLPSDRMAGYRPESGGGPGHEPRAETRQPLPWLTR